jgi:hypothetical protein
MTDDEDWDWEWRYLWKIIFDFEFVDVIDWVSKFEICDIKRIN